MKLISKKKYSLKQRTDYYYNIYNAESRKPAISRSKRYQYAYGFLKGAPNGLSQDFAKCSKSEQAGQRAGFNALIKSKNVKF